MNFYLKVAEYNYKLSDSVRDDLAAVYLTDDKSSLLSVGKTYFARFNRTSSQSDEQFYLSMKRLKFRGIDENGNCAFSFYGGDSALEKNYSKSTIFGPTSLFYLYLNEYSAADTTEQPLISCVSKGYASSFQDQVVKYKAVGSFPANEDRAYSAWFNISKNSRFSTPITSLSVDDNNLTATVSYSTPHDFFVGDLVSLRRASGGNFNLIGEVKSVENQKQVTLSFSYDLFAYVNTVFPSWKTFTDIKAQVTIPHVFMNNMSNGLGIKIDLLEKRYFRVFANDKVYNFFMPNTVSELAENKWYNVCVSISNIFSQLTLNVWSIQWSESTNLPATSDLRLYFGKTVNGIDIVDRSSAYNYFITPSDCSLTNLRVWSQKIETDKQALVVNQNIVKDASRAIVIDNAIPQSKLPYVSYTH